MGIAAAGATVTVTGINIETLRDRRNCGGRDVEDLVGLMQQLRRDAGRDGGVR